MRRRKCREKPPCGSSSDSLTRFPICWPTMSPKGCDRWSLMWILLFDAAALFSTEFKCAQGMQVMATGTQTVLRAEGESVTLGCRYTPSPLDAGELDIEWSVINPDTTQKDHMLISYTSGSTYVHGNAGFTKSLSFAANDPSAGDASLSMVLLTPAQSATYQCKVKKSPGVDMLKVSLVVMVKPSVPKCWLESEDRVGEVVSLRCKSEEGSGPLTYSWRRGSTGAVPETATQNSITGELTIGNHSQGTAGLYLCEANNAVGVERCRIILGLSKPPNRFAVIIGTTVGSLLLIFVLLVYIAIFSWKLRSRLHDEKEYSNEIREDAPPPRSRSVSRQTNWSSSCHLPVAYSPLAAVDVNGPADGSPNAAPTESREDARVRPPPVEYDSQYGYAV
ncbi:coxsackievirus and adenovirus receptor homolog isoform X1 [Nelusetta ayraudi]|uniref:coxsackievirus and adenovirus receptor homolog isoform X1 n=1 Tax=Nelusetta ayraudi TaxID=303726 RepID=UPI003F72ECE7